MASSVRSPNLFNEHVKLLDSFYYKGVSLKTIAEQSAQSMFDPSIQVLALELIKPSKARASSKHIQQVARRHSVGGGPRKPLAHILSIFSIYLMFCIAIEVHKHASEFLNPGIETCLRRQSSTFGFLMNTLMNTMGSSCPATLDKQNKMNMILLTFLATVLAGKPNLQAKTFTIDVKNVYNNLHQAYFTVYETAYTKVLKGTDFVAPVIPPQIVQKTSSKSPASDRSGSSSSSQSEE